MGLKQRWKKLEEKTKKTLEQMNQLGKDIDDKFLHPIVKAFDSSKECKSNIDSTTQQEDKLSLFCSGELKEDACNHDQHKQEGWNVELFNAYCCIQNIVSDNFLEENKIEQDCSGKLQDLVCAQGYHLQEG